MTFTLASLVLLDTVLAIAAFGFPELWFYVFHGTAPLDPENLLRRTGASWLMFAVLQAIALKQWRDKPYWLIAISAVRFSDMLTDWTYLAFAHDRTWFALAALGVASPANLLLGIYLWSEGLRPSSPARSQEQ